MDFNAIAEAVVKGAELLKVVNFISAKVDELFQADHRNEAQALGFRMLQEFMRSDKVKLDSKTRDYIADQLNQLAIETGKGV